MEMPRNPLFTLFFYLSIMASSQGTPAHCAFLFSNPSGSTPPRGSLELTCGLVEGMYAGPFALQGVCTV